MSEYYGDKNFEMYLSKGIMYSVPKAGCIITKDVSEAMILERIKISKEVSYTVILDSRLVKYWTMDSRNNNMKANAYVLVKCAAIVIKSKAVKVMWNYAIRLFAVPVPSKVFNELEQAQVWVEKYK